MHGIKRCRTVRNLLPLYLDGVLSLRDHDDVRSHLQHCQSCAKWLELERPLEFELPPLPPPILERFIEDLDAGLDAALSDPSRRRRCMPTSFWSGYRMPITWLSGLVIGASTSLVVTIWWKQHTPPETFEMARGNQRWLEQTQSFRVPDPYDPDAIRQSRLTDVYYDASGLPVLPSSFGAGNYEGAFLADIAGGP